MSSQNILISKNFYIFESTIPLVSSYLLRYENTSGTPDYYQQLTTTAMKTYTNGSKATGTPSFSNGDVQKKTKPGISHRFVDHRSEAITHQTLQEATNNSPQALQTAQFQQLSDHYAARQAYPIQQKENRTGLPDQLKAGIENLSGYSMDDVNVHYNSDKPASLQAYAYAQGTDIHIAPGQERHLPHEAWHVVQQKQGRVQPTTQMKGGVDVNDDAGLEKEADAVGARAVSMNISTIQQRIKKGGGGSQTAQCVLLVNGSYVSRAVLATKKAEIIRDTTGPLKERGHDNITAEQWDLVFSQLDIIAQDGESFEFNRTSEVIAMILSGQLAAQIMETSLGPGAKGSIPSSPSKYKRPDIPLLDLSKLERTDSSTAFLQDMEPTTDTSRWNGGHDQLKDAHHKIGKNVLAWLYEHMDKESQGKIKRALHLNRNSQALALTRLGSNLIAPDHERKRRVATSDSRTDDPMNNSKQSEIGKEYLDLMTDTSGSLTPRSKIYHHLADSLVRAIYERFKGWVDEEKDPNLFRLNSEEVDGIVAHLRQAEILNFKLERKLNIPSHSSLGDAFVAEDTGGGKTQKYTKAKVDPISGDLSEDDIFAYDAIASASLMSSIAMHKEVAANKLPSFEKWLNMYAENITEDIYDMEDQYEEWAIDERINQLYMLMDADSVTVKKRNHYFPDIIKRYEERIQILCIAEVEKIRNALSIYAIDSAYESAKLKLKKVINEYL